MAMSMRSRGGAGAGNRGRSGLRPTYEDFKPMSEWKYDQEGADILLYHLPGFLKEQIRILAESKGVLRVRGERFIGGNKWSRFQEEVVVPEDCNMSEIRARFEGGILRIIMPKKIKTTPTEPAGYDRTSITAPNPVRNPTSPAYDRTSANAPDPVKTTPTGPTPADKVQSSAINDYEPPKASTPKPDIQTIPQQAQEEASSPSDSKQAQIMEGERKYKEAIDHHEKAKGVEDHHHTKDNVKEKNEVYEEKREANVVEGYKRATNKTQLVPRNLEEDRQLLVNMGVAVLVIVGLGAYISYSFGSST